MLKELMLEIEKQKQEASKILRSELLKDKFFDDYKISERKRRPNSDKYIGYIWINIFSKKDDRQYMLTLYCIDIDAKSGNVHVIHDRIQLYSGIKRINNRYAINEQLNNEWVIKYNEKKCYDPRKSIRIDEIVSGDADINKILRRIKRFINMDINSKNKK